MAAVTDGVAPFELAVACEVFGIDRSDLGVEWYEFRLAAVEGGPVRTSLGYAIATPYGVADIDQADTVVVPAGTPEPETSPAMIAALQRAHARGARVLSECTGAFALAAAGLLDGRRATTHWMHTAELASRYPAIDVDPNVLYVDGGDGIYTSAGTASGIDLCLHIVREDFGADIANAVARRMVVPPHRDGGQAQYVDMPVPCCDDDLFTDTLTWLQANLGEPVSVDDLARRSAMSPRSFARRFKAATGTTPHQWLIRQRVLHAQRLLETTDLSVDQIATRCGFGTTAGFRDQFQRIVRTSPTAYRRTFATAAAHI